MTGQEPQSRDCDNLQVFAKKIEDYLPEEHVITIQSPQRKIKQRKLFTFLDEEEEHGE